jgi:asparagine synthase (glutamine-hydrolysing)
VYDEKNKSLILARDRVGIKPLYYCVTNEALWFASEIKAILSDPTVPTEIDLNAIDSFLTFSYLPGEETLFKHIRKLKPGHYLRARKGTIKIAQYWDLQFTGSRARQSVDDSAQELNDLLAETVRNHMISDVPVGILLSGGVDSSAMLSYAAENATTPLSTFTIGFDEHRGLDERASARLVASRFGTKHYEATVTAHEFLEWLPKYVWHMEEPVCEPPAIALYYITKLARQHVTVLLSGEGADEAFAGYKNYRNLVWLEKAKAALGPVAYLISRASNKIARIVGSSELARYAAFGASAFANYYYSRVSGPCFFNGDRHQFYSPEFSNHLHGNVHDAFRRQVAAATMHMDTLQQMLYIDTKTWLPDDLLVKADKMTMANSVELRVPFLDHRVLEFAASLPSSHKLHGLQTKYILKRALARRLPVEILGRPKTGFPVPYDIWLRTKFREFAWEVLTDSQSKHRGYFEPKAIQRLLTANQADATYSKEIFSLIVLELWHRLFASNGQPSGWRHRELAPVAVSVH